MYYVCADLSQKSGKIKPLHGVCCAPYGISYGSDQILIDKYFTEGGMPFCRLHDCCYPYGWGKFIDVSNIFPDPSADENAEESYDFHYSDEYISAIRKTGCEIYYRLGESIEWGSKKISTVAPKDPKKWARICEHIIMHYNEGWNNGFRYNIKYWEIWNEPENPGSTYGSSMWQGTEAEYFELYAQTSTYLKSKFPSIKIGGYGSCGFYTHTRTNAPREYEDFIPYLKRFLSTVKEKGCPLDFFSWHIYSASVTELLSHAECARNILDEYGFTDTESHLNEWNYDAEGTSFAEKHTAVAAAFNCAVFSALQSTEYVDKAMYYCFSSESRYNGLFDRNDGKVDPPFFSFVAFNKLYTLGNCVKTDTSGNGVYAIAAENDGKAAVMITNLASESDMLRLEIKGLGKKSRRLSFKLLDKDSTLKELLAVGASESFTAEFELKRDTVLLIEAQ